MGDANNGICRILIIYKPNRDPSPKPRQDAPVILSGGGMARSLSGGLGGVLLRLGPSFLIAVAITTMNQGAEAIADALHSALFGSYIERSTRPHQYSSHVHALFRASCDDSPDDIPCLEALALFRSLWFGAGEAEFIDVAFLPVAVSGRCNEQGNDPSQLELQRRAFANAG